MKIVVAESVTRGAEAFAPFAKSGEVVRLPETAITRADLLDAEVLVTRSKTRVTADLIDGTALRFYGTCTAGTDHVDFDACAARDLHAVAAPGCNANAVSEYLVAALLILESRHGLHLPDLTLGIVGHGHVGQRVEAKARALGMNVVLNDPPRAAAGHQPDTGAYLDLADVLAHSDVLTLHVPLDSHPEHPTRDLLNPDTLRLVRPCAFLINACRGEVIDTESLLAHNPFAALILDVFDPEPAFPPALFRRVLFGTPHIAGHSFEGKLNGTLQVAAQLYDFLGAPADITPWDPADVLAPDTAKPLHLDAARLPPARAIRAAVRAGYNVRPDHNLLADALDLPDSERAAVFTHRRRNYPRRREFPAIPIRATGYDTSFVETLIALGFPANE